MKDLSNPKVTASPLWLVEQSCKTSNRFCRVATLERTCPSRWGHPASFPSPGGTFVQHFAESSFYGTAVHMLGGFMVGNLAAYTCYSSYDLPLKHRHSVSDPPRGSLPAEPVKSINARYLGGSWHRWTILFHKDRWIRAINNSIMEQFPARKCSRTLLPATTRLFDCALRIFTVFVVPMSGYSASNLQPSSVVQLRHPSFDSFIAAVQLCLQLWVRTCRWDIGHYRMPCVVAPCWHVWGSILCRTAPDASISIQKACCITSFFLSFLVKLPRLSPRAWPKARLHCGL